MSMFEEGAPIEPLVEPLTRRERQILALLAEGFSGPEIAERLTLALSSVKSHIQHLYGKLGVNGKRQALTRAAQLGLLGGAAAAEGALAVSQPAGAAGTALPAAALAAPLEPSETPEPGESPYKGLPYFDESDAAIFFGREALVARLVTRLAARPNPAQPAPPHFLAVVGASGSGKSSIVRAGHIPALRTAAGLAVRFDPIHLITPTAHPLEALAASLTRGAESVSATATLLDDLGRDERALHLFARRLFYTRAETEARPWRSNSRLLLVIDQFEELFTLCRGEAERQAFIASLVAAAAPEADGSLTILITLRADFYSACAPYAPLRDLLANQQEYIGPMSAGELRQAIERPARLGRWEFAPRLVDLILRDVGDEPGTLPLLSHALLETWRHRRGRSLTLESYGEAGGVQGAIATTAEEVFRSLPPEEQAIARGIFLRLTELGEGTQDTRRRVSLQELTPSTAGDSPVARVLQTLSNARLITVADAEVQVAHEALIREWPTLRQWLTDDRDGLRLHRHLIEVAQEWDEFDRDPGELYRGPRLAEAAQWAAAHDPDLNPLERDFLAASQALVEREAAEQEAQRQHELEAARGLAEAQRQRAEAEARRAAEQSQAASRLRARNRVITAVGVLALLAALAAGFFGLQASRSAVVAQVANTQSAENLSAAQAAGTEAIVQRDEAQRQGRLVAANQLALQANSVLNAHLSLALLLSAEANQIAITDQTRNSLLTAFKRSPHLPALLRGHTDYVAAVAFSPDGNRVASGSLDGSLLLWDVVVGQSVAPPVSAQVAPVRSLAFSPNGKLLALGGMDGSLRLWDMAAGAPQGAPLAGHPAPVASVAFSPDGRVLASGSSDKKIILWDVATGRRLGPPLAGHTDAVTGVAFSPDGKWLASGSQDGTVWLWDAATGQPLGAPLVGHRGPISSVAFSPDGKLLAAGSYAQDILLWDLAQPDDPAAAPVPAPSEPLAGHAAQVTSLAFSRSGRLLVSGSADGTLRLWDVATRQPLGPPLVGHDAPVLAVAFAPNEAVLASGSADQAVGLWQVQSGLLPLGGQDWLSNVCAIAGRNLTRAEWEQYLTGMAYNKTCAQWPEGR